MKAIGILRDRGQLTIPGEFRNFVGWLYPNSVLSLSFASDNKLVISPQQPASNWERITLLRARTKNMSGRSTQSVTEFLRKDRQSH